jgi:predicted  nucleic acid-binding Zn-ribbon protein
MKISKQLQKKISTISNEIDNHQWQLAEIENDLSTLKSNIDLDDPTSREEVRKLKGAKDFIKEIIQEM